jgi:hypothetical protein
VLHEELPQVFAVFTVVFECGVMFAEMLEDCFIASKFSCDISDASALFTREFYYKGTRPPEQITDAYERANDAIR